MSKKSKKIKPDLIQVQKNLNTQIKSYSAPRKNTDVSSKRVPLKTPSPVRKIKPEKDAASLKMRGTKPITLTRAQIHQKTQLERFKRIRELQKSLQANKNYRQKLKLASAQKTVQLQIQKAEDRHLRREVERKRIEECSKRKERSNVMQKIFKKAGFGATKLKKLTKDMRNSKWRC